MQISAQSFLKIVELNNQMCFFDIEASGLNGDYNCGLIVSVKPYRQNPITLVADKPGDDRRLVNNARKLLNQFPLWVSFYGKGFDVKFLNTRLIRHNLPILSTIHHIDMYWVIKFSTNTARRSQAHLLEFINSPMKKLTIPPEIWNKVLRDPVHGFAILKKRCESDVIGLENLYIRFKSFIREIQK